MAQTATVVGEVTYREGDGPQMTIRPGPIEVTLGDNDVTLSWSDGDSNGATAIPLDEYRRFVKEGAIRVDA